MWAETPALSFLRTPDETRAMLEAAEFSVRVWVDNSDQVERVRSMGHADPRRKFSLHEMAKGDVMFACTGVTSGRDRRGGTRASEPCPRWRPTGSGYPRGGRRRLPRENAQLAAQSGGGTHAADQCGAGEDVIPRPAKRTGHCNCAAVQCARYQLREIPATLTDGAINQRIVASVCRCRLADCCATRSCRWMPRVPRC